MNIMVMANFNFCFTFASAGWEGYMHDYHIFKDIVRVPKKDDYPHPKPSKYYLVDVGYPNKPGYLAPYKEDRYHLKDFKHERHRVARNDEEFFNKIEDYVFEDLPDVDPSFAEAVDKYGRD
ncbi:hypothetical protein Vadar_023032 [Vaccinium darrowii]|uniref:Uncharacterized protein n=1 Tax=Vaccinium darrowii TaxID=229202 RepID=A0ACB7YY38_9ERIC|nr:hypothetical protein Vadar_023032 [Vaccinium darrowii]